LKLLSASLISGFRLLAATVPAVKTLEIYISQVIDWDRKLHEPREITDPNASV
jgi:hypothetical protein